MSTFPSYPVELDAPDIGMYRAGNTGVPYYTTIDSGTDGPHVLINAVVHGNELCGAIAVDTLMRRRIRPTRGRLTLGFANVAAYRQFDPDQPNTTRYVDEDFNRVWDVATLEGDRMSVELARAREIRPLIDTVDFLLDIHSMQHRTPPLMMAGPLEKGRALARAIGYPRHVIADAGHAAGRRLRDYGAFADPASPRNALLVECGQHWERAAAPIAIEASLRFLLHFDMIDRGEAAPHLSADLPAQQVIEVTDAVTITTDAFRFADDFVGMECLPRAGTMIGHDGDRPVVTPYDNCVLIMPTRRLHKGQTAVRLGRLIG
jgi:predicted deacylase